MCPISRYSSHRSRLEGEEEEEGEEEGEFRCYGESDEVTCPTHSDRG